MRRPAWWNWEIEITSHIEKRMAQRGFNEIDLRAMLDNERGIRPDITKGRWIVTTLHRNADWEVIVEPDFDEKLQVIITAYPTGE